MPIVQLMVLGLIVSAFALFIIVLLSVSLYVESGKKEEAPTTAVTPARRPGAGADEMAPPSHSDVRRFG